MRGFLYTAVIFLLLQLSACAEIQSAPVVDGWQTTAGLDSEYIVHKDDTIYTIAWVFGISYKDIAKSNNLAPPYSVKGVTLLKMPAPQDSGFADDQPAATGIGAPAVAAAAPAASARMPQQPKQSHKVYPVAKPHRASSVVWRWPLQGTVIAGFKSGNPPNKGIDIAASYAEPVFAAAGGEVVYSGSGLQGYGNLIIIKHAHDVMTAYAYNSTLLVGLGARVRAGQQIAKVGRGPSGRPLLHFEIRDDGHPVNPLNLLRK